MRDYELKQILAQLPHPDEVLGEVYRIAINPPVPSGALLNGTAVCAEEQKIVTFIKSGQAWALYDVPGFKRT